MDDETSKWRKNVKYSGKKKERKRNLHLLSLKLNVIHESVGECNVMYR